MPTLAQLHGENRKYWQVSEMGLGSTMVPTCIPPGVSREAPRGQGHLPHCEGVNSTQPAHLTALIIIINCRRG